MDGSQSLLKVLERPCTPAAAATGSGLSPIEVALLLTQLHAERRVAVYCDGHFMRRRLVLDFEDGPARSDWPRSRRVMASLTRLPTTLDVLVVRSGVPARAVLNELASLTLLGVARSASLPGSPRGWARLDPVRDRYKKDRRAVGVLLVQTSILAHLAAPARLSDLIAALGWSRDRLKRSLGALVRSGRVLVPAKDVFVAVADWVDGLPLADDCSEIGGSARPQLVRDAIMAFLHAEPRRAIEIAQTVSRSVPCVTGHLRAMQARGLVERIGYGRYARSDMPGLPPAAQRDLRRPGTPGPLPHKPAVTIPVLDTVGR